VALVRLHVLVDDDGTPNERLEGNVQALCDALAR
jgi:hypothetical protein